MATDHTLQISLSLSLRVYMVPLLSVIVSFLLPQLLQHERYSIICSTHLLSTLLPHISIFHYHKKAILMLDI